MVGVGAGALLAGICDGGTNSFGREAAAGGGTYPGISSRTDDNRMSIRTLTTDERWGWADKSCAL
jgi:hypothetical protein